MEVISRHPANSREIGGLNTSHPLGSEQPPASAQVLRTTSTRATHRYHQRSQTTPPMWCGIIGGGPRALATLLCAALVLWLGRSAFLQFRGGHTHEREQRQRIGSLHVGALLENIRVTWTVVRKMFGTTERWPTGALRTTLTTPPLSARSSQTLGLLLRLCLPSCG